MIRFLQSVILFALRGDNQPSMLWILSQGQRKKTPLNCRLHLALAKTKKTQSSHVPWHVLWCCRHKCYSLCIWNCWVGTPQIFIPYFQCINLWLVSYSKPASFSNRTCSCFFTLSSFNWYNSSPYLRFWCVAKKWSAFLAWPLPVAVLYLYQCFVSFQTRQCEGNGIPSLRGCGLREPVAVESLEKLIFVHFGCNRDEMGKKLRWR